MTFCDMLAAASRSCREGLSCTHVPTSVPKVDSQPGLGPDGFVYSADADADGGRV